MKKQSLGHENHPEELPGGSADEDLVKGERGWPSVARARSLQSRVSSLLACILMIVLGVGILAWYYSRAFSRSQRSQQTERAAAASRAQGEIALPVLGKIEQPATPARVEPATDHSEATREPISAPPPVPPSLEQMAVAPAQQGWVTGGPAQYGPGAVATPEQSAFQRRTAGAAFARTSDAVAAGGLDGSVSAANQGVSPIAGSSVGNLNPRPAGDLPALLQPSVVVPARAEVLPTKSFLLPKGAFIDCTLETAIDSTLPGMTTCVTATDTFGVDGEVVLLERGTKLIGETRGQVQQGTARVFVLWTSARTPTGVIVPLDSPGADELGRSGLTGEVERHFWQRFGAGILISTLDGAVQAGVQSTTRGGGAVIYSPSSSEGIATDVLKSTVNIPPTITKRNGDRIQVLVARDVDFRGVYELRRTAIAP